VLASELNSIYQQLFGQPSPFAVPLDTSAKADGLNNRGVAYATLGKESDSIACWEAAIKEDPQHLAARFNLGYVNWVRGAISGDVYAAELQDLE
jgi:hypothetical protein